MNSEKMPLDNSVGEMFDLGDWNLERRPSPANLKHSDIEIFRPQEIKATPAPRISAHIGTVVREQTPFRASEKLIRAVRPTWFTPREIAIATRPSERNEVPSIAGAAWFLGDSPHNYFHWITEDLVRASVISALMPEIPLLVPERLLRIGHVAETLEMGQFPTLRLGQRTEIYPKFLFIAHNDLEAGHYRSASIGSTKRLLIEATGLEHPRKRNRIWISRLTVAKRRLKNEKLLSPVFRKYDIDVVRMESLSLREQIEMSMGASFMGGLHGAGLVNQIFCPPNSAVLEIKSPNDLFNNCYFTLAGAMGHRYFYSIGETRVGTRNADVFLDPDQLDDTLKEIFG